MLPLDRDALNNVVFIIGDTYDRSSGKWMPGPVGTGFFVGLRGTADKVPWHLYVVTAGHVVHMQASTSVRITSFDGTVIEDVPIEEWFISESEDLAVAPIDPSAYPGAGVVHIALEPKWAAVGTSPIPNTRLGATVYFLGLMTHIDSMNRRNIPMVRSGTVGALYVDDMPLADGKRAAAAHLIDCRSYGGFSGSPCFLQWTDWNVLRHRDEPRTTPGRLQRTAKSLLLGMLIQHFDDQERQEGRPVMTINVGVGIVLPAQAIRTFLEGEELTQMRKTREDEQHDPPRTQGD